MLQDTFRFLFPSKLPQIDEETNVNVKGGNEHASLHQSSRKALFKSSLEKAALGTLLMSDANMATFYSFCARLDIGKSTDMVWSNVAADLGYTIPDIQWIVEKRSGSNSLTCIQDFLGRTPISKSEAAFCLLHQSVAETENTAALKELESVQIMLENGTVTTIARLVSSDLHCSTAFHDQKTVLLHKADDCHVVSALPQSKETCAAQYGTCV